MPTAAKRNMPMILAPSIDSASSLLWWSNVVYIGGAVLTLAAAMHVRHEKRRVDAGLKSRVSFRSEASVVLAAIVSLAGTAGAIYFGDRVSHLKDIELSKYQQQAAVQIAGAQQDSAKANSEAAIATAGAKVAQEKAEQARQKAEAIHAKAEEARTNSLEAEKQANEAVIDKEEILKDNLTLQKQVEDERTARLELEQRLAPRALTLFAQNNLTRQVQAISGVSVDLIVISGNSEAQNLGSQIAFGLQSGHIDFHFIYPMGGSTQGVVIEFDPTDKGAEKVARAIGDALTESQIRPELVSSLPPLGQQVGAYTSDGKSGSGKVRIFIGNKP